MKKLIIISIAIIVLIIVIFASDQVSQRQALSAVEIKIYDVYFEGLNLYVDLAMYNPNRVTATLDKMDFKVYSGSNMIFDGYIDKRYSIPSKKAIIVPVDVDLSFGGLGKTLLNKLTGGSTDYTITGKAYYDTPIGSFVIPFEKDLWY